MDRLSIAGEDLPLVDVNVYYCLTEQQRRYFMGNYREGSIGRREVEAGLKGERPGSKWKRSPRVVKSVLIVNRPHMGDASGVVSPLPAL
ncbi:MAG: hypothetical protein C1O27_002087 [Chloroflexi bacterium]|nr:MAG: hypothetical protein C1O27_002087 [Chloroflexota bacterium]